MLENVNWRDLLPALTFMVAILVLFWLFILRPAKQRQEQHQKLIVSLQTGDKVVTAGGIYGTVVRVYDRTIHLKVAEDVVLVMDRRAVRRHQPGEGS